MATAIESEPAQDERGPGRTLPDLLPYAVIGLGHAPLLYVYLQQLWDRPHYQFFPLVLLAAAWLFASRWEERRAPRLRAVVLSRVLLAVSAGLLALAIARLSPVTGYFSFVLVAGGFILRTGVPAFGPWMLLLLLLRIPYGQDVAAIQAMQRLTTALSSTALDSLGIEHFTEGNVLVFPSRSLFVEEACSGVVSMLAIVACAGILAAWWRRSLLHGTLLLASGVFWAGTMNVVRVMVIALTLSQWGIDLTEGWRHGAAGLLVFAVSLTALISTDLLLLVLLGRIKMNPLAPYWVYAASNPLIRVWNWCNQADDDIEPEASYGDHADDWDDPQYDDEPASDEFQAAPAPSLRLSPRWEWAAAAVFVLLGGMQAFAGIGPFSVAPPVRQDFLDLAADDLPEEWNGWKRVGFEAQERDSSSAFGENSRAWTYRRGSRAVVLSLDFVFPEWHALTACYAGAGWTVHEQSHPDAGGTRVEATLTKPNGETAFLMYDLFDSEGQPYVSPGGSFLHPQLRRILGGEATRFTLPSYYQVQLLSGVGGEGLPEEERLLLRKLFDAFEEQMRLRVEG